jgi:hypothetical protein
MVPQDQKVTLELLVLKEKKDYKAKLGHKVNRDQQVTLGQQELKALKVKLERLAHKEYKVKQDHRDL